MEHEKTQATLALMQGSSTKLDATLLDAEEKFATAKAAHAASVAFYLRLNQDYQQCQSDFHSTRDTLKRERSIVDILGRKVAQFKALPASSGLPKNSTPMTLTPMVRLYSPFLLVPWQCTMVLAGECGHAFQC